MSDSTRRDFLRRTVMAGAVMALPLDFSKLGKDGKKPNIVFIFSDDHAQQAISAYGESTPSQVNYLLAITEINLGNLQEAGNVLVRLRDDPEYAERARRLDDFVMNSLNSQ